MKYKKTISSCSVWEFQDANIVKLTLHQINQKEIFLPLQCKKYQNSSPRNNMRIESWTNFEIDFKFLILTFLNSCRNLLFKKCFSLLSSYREVTSVS